MTRDPKGGGDRPIIFSGPMVRALLDGRKTQTRRLLKANIPPMPAMDNISPSNTTKHPTPYLDSYCSEKKTAANLRGMSRLWCWWTRDDRSGREFKVGYMPGMRLYVREAWCQKAEDGAAVSGAALYRADGEHVALSDGDGFTVTRQDGREASPWRPSIHMPRWASRLTLVVTDVRVQRLQNISEADALSEGIEPLRFPETGDWGWPQHRFRDLWNSIHGPDAWDANPEVVALTFTVHCGNIDKI